MDKDKTCLIEMKLNLFIKENPQYEYIKVVPEKVKTKVRRKK